MLALDRTPIVQRFLVFGACACCAFPSLSAAGLRRRKQRREEHNKRWDRDPWLKRERRPEWQCSVCNSRNWLTRETGQDCEKQRRTTDVVIGALEPAFPPQPPVQRPKMAVQAAEGAYKAACEAGLPKTLLSELHAELEAR